MTDEKPRYKFVAGRGDDEHATKLNDLKGYIATLLVFDGSHEAFADNRQIVVLMERESH